MLFARKDSTADEMVYGSVCILSCHVCVPCSVIQMCVCVLPHRVMVRLDARSEPLLDHRRPLFSVSASLLLLKICL